MKYKFLGNTGVRVSELCMGTMTFGREADKTAASAIFKRALDAGINFFDCADLYAKGEAEIILGGLVAGCRDEVFITSKVYFPVFPGQSPGGLSRRYIMAAAEASLRRLNTTHLDLYFAHRFDENTSMEDTLRALDDLVAQGKTRYLGVSNFAAWQVEKALGLAALKGWTPFQCIQPMYNLVKRQAEVELLPMAQAEKMGVITYSPLGGGLLTGKYGGRLQSAPGRLAGDAMYQRRYGEEQTLAAAGRFVDYARQRGYDPAALAIAWVAAHPAVTAPIIGARNLEQLDNCLKALDAPMTADLYGELCALTPAPPPATDRNEEVRPSPGG